MYFLNSWRNELRLWAIPIAALASTLFTAMACAHPHPESSRCGAVGTWLDPATGETIATDRLFAAFAQRPIVLLGEAHDNPAHHRWELSTLAALHGRKPDMIIGFESFPRRVQPILDQWVAGELDAHAFLEAVDWDTIWGFDPNLYLPLFYFARQNRVPMLALNVDRDFVSRVRREGWAAIPTDERHGLSDPAAASAAYRESLAEIYGIEQKHQMEAAGSGSSEAGAGEAEGPTDETPAPATTTAPVDAGSARDEPNAAPDTASAPRADECDAPSDACGAAAQPTGVSAESTEVPAAEVDTAAILESEDFARFVAAQLTWDRAMAEALAAARRRQPDALVVGILGRGHVEHRYGVPHQLADLGIPDAAVALPAERSAVCDGLDADLADAVFVIESPPQSVTAPPRPRLGVMLKQTDEGVQIVQVVKGSVAEATGLQANDIVVSAAGFPISHLGELVEIVQRQAPGTWLPLTIRREGSEVEFVAKFPTEFESPE